jgi:hypothetical protein
MDCDAGGPGKTGPAAVAAVVETVAVYGMLRGGTGAFGGSAPGAGAAASRAVQRMVAVGLIMRLAESSGAWFFGFFGAEAE